MNTERAEENELESAGDLDSLAKAIAESPRGHYRVVSHYLVWKNKTKPMHQGYLPRGCRYLCKFAGWSSE